MRIGIVIIATNSYFVLGIRFMRKFMHHYKGKADIQFHFFSDTDPEDYLPQHFPVTFYPTKHDNWVDGTNSKFRNILSILEMDDYLFYFDADTNVDKDFTEEWFVADMVGGEHYGNRGWMKDKKAYDRNPRSKAFVPENTRLPQTYYYGAFFGGSYNKLMEFCKTMVYYQDMDKKINYEPSVNDESYINREFHFHPPSKVIPCEDFVFLVSDKGGLGETRQTSLDITDLKLSILENRYKLFDIQNGQIHFI
jgi:hypothetical protein